MSSSNADIIASVRELRDTVESLRTSVDAHKRDVSIALAGDYTAPGAKPGLIQTVGLHVVACNDDRRKLWQAVRAMMAVILLILGWIVAGKITSQDPPPASTPSRVVTQP